MFYFLSLFYFCLSSEFSGVDVAGIFPVKNNVEKQSLHPFRSKFIALNIVISHSRKGTTVPPQWKNSICKINFQLSSFHLWLYFETS